MNRVEVFATSNQLAATGIGSRVVQIDVPGASSADLSSDGTTVRVGTITQQIVAMNTTSLQIQSRYSIQPLSPVPNTTFDRPEELLVLAGGNFLLLDGALKQIAAQPSTGIRGLAFSRDRTSLYASQSGATFPAIQVLNGQTLQTIGQVPDTAIQGVQSEIEDVDETQLLFAIANRGVSFIDAANSSTLPQLPPHSRFRRSCSRPKAPRLVAHRPRLPGRTSKQPLS